MCSKTDFKEALNDFGPTLTSLEYLIDRLS